MRRLHHHVCFDLARVAIGQGGEEGEVRASVTQMAEVAATVANGGKLMKPTLVQQVIDPDGRVTEELDPEVQSEVMSEETAAEIPPFFSGQPCSPTSGTKATGPRSSSSHVSSPVRVRRTRLWRFWLSPTGITSLPAIASWSFRACGAKGAPAATRIASKGAASGQPLVPSPILSSMLA